MMKRMKLLIPILVISITAACSNLFNKDGNSGPELDLQTSQSPSKTTTFNGDTLVFSPISYGEQPEKYPPFKSQIDGGQIIINGYYLASSGFLPAGELEVDNKQVTIQIHRAEFDNAAPDIPKGYFYDAYIRDLSSGKYTVKIIHEDDLMWSQTDEIGEAHTIFEKEFEVE